MIPEESLHLVTCGSWRSLTTRVCTLRRDVHRYSLILASGVLLATSPGCKRSEPQQSTSGAHEDSLGPAWMAAVVLRVTGTRPAFGENIEVALSVENQGKNAIVIQRLDAPMAAELVRAGGAASRIHKLSVGVTKPIALAPREKRAVSLLFEAGPGEPQALRLYGKEWPL